MKFYAGIGSRETPDDVCATMQGVAIAMRERGYTLRSGGAAKADSAFELGAKGQAEIYLPWGGFNGKSGICVTSTPWSQSILLQFHPNPKALTRGGIALMERNTYQVLGPTEDAVHSEFVACWTKGGKPTGGTGQALRIAAAYHIPIFNLAIEGDLSKLFAFVNSRR